jgi:hypothetical protein
MNNLIDKIKDTFANFTMTILALFIYFLIWTGIINTLLSKEYDNNAAGGMMIVGLQMISSLLFITYFIGFIIAAKTNKSKRRIYLMISLLLFVPIIILFMAS